MDIKKFQDKSGKNMKTVESWLKKGIVPGAAYRDGKWEFSELAMAPYTGRRTKKANATSIRKSIVKAALQHKSTCAKLYDLPAVVFDSYVRDLEDHGIVQVYTDPLFPGDKFIYTTMKTDEYLRAHGVFGNEGVAGKLVSKAVEGAVTALINQSFGAKTSTSATGVGM